MPKTTTSKLSREQIRALTDEYEVPLRNLATRLLGDPVEGDAVVTGALHALRRAAAEHLRTRGAEEYLRDVVINRCLRRYARMVEREQAAAPHTRRGRAA
jgi:DNA-directed RNA polymerase specialized sigma24 family protein